MTFTQTTPRAVTIVGPGKVGHSLARAAAQANLEARLLGRAEVESGEIGRGQPGSGDQLILLAVPDSEIASACEAVCRSAPNSSSIGHLSGATDLSALAAATAAGRPTFSMHPLQSFASNETRLAGVPAAITACDPETYARVSALATRLGMSPFALAEEDRALYHAAASIASNFLVCLEEEAASLLETTRIGNGRRLLTPLVTQTVANWAEQGGSALTGPIARGDRRTVERHLEALRQHAPQLVSAYLAMAERTQALANGSRTGQPRPGEAVEA